MTYYDSFDCKINCEDLIEVTPEEQEEVFALIAQEAIGAQGFEQWLDSLEAGERADYLTQQAFERRIEQQSTLQTPQGAILIKRDCSHSECAAQSRCKREVRYGGITI